MKQIYWILIFPFFLITTLNAQENKSYITVSGSMGKSGFDYKLEQGTDKIGLGYGAQAGYSYFFNPHWGISTGIGFSRYKTTGKRFQQILPDRFESLGNQIDDDDISGNPREYELRVRMGNLEEQQKTIMLEIPLMGAYQTYFGDEEKWGMYTQAGVKLQIPVRKRFTVQKGELNISGFYPHSEIDKGAPGAPPVDHHGFGTVSDVKHSLGWKGSDKLKIGVAASAELGFLFVLSQKWELLLGGYLDYGLIDISKSKKRPLLSAPEKYLPGANGQPGNGIRYNGFLNSTLTDKIKPISFGGKITLRFIL